VAVEHLLQLDTSDPSIWMLRGDVCVQRKDYKRALTSYNRAIELDPETAWAWVGKAACLRLLGRYQQADRAERHARKLGVIIRH
jgi:Flp pilus assembly protein TadD